jgi:hypothetical protein
MKSARRLIGAGVLVVAACAPAAAPTAPTSPPPPANVAATPAASPAASPVAIASPVASPAASPVAIASPVSAASPSPAASPAASPPPSPVAGASPAAGPATKTGLATIHAISSVPRDPNFMSDVWADFEFESPITNEAELRRVVDGMLGLTGVAEVETDGAHMRVMYDTARVLPPRMRARLEELGHPPTAGTEVPAGDSSD